jgi:post-segregation antitoxin (ccd killing protein)
MQQQRVCSSNVYAAATCMQQQRVCSSNVYAAATTHLAAQLDQNDATEYQ